MAVFQIVLASLAVFVGQVVGVMIAEFLIYEHVRKMEVSDDSETTE
jgi:cytosine/uracil/thiamine/allantoin permease